jgi:hypothetical protein
MKYLLTVLLFAGLVSTGCRSSANKGLMSIDSMKLVMWDMLRADEMYSHMTLKDSLARGRREDIRLYEEVFAAHRITKGYFDSSYKYFASHPADFKILIDSLDAFSARERSKVFNFGQGH